VRLAGAAGAPSRMETVNSRMTSARRDEPDASPDETTVPAGLLRYALKASQPFVPVVAHRSKPSDEVSVVQMFDASRPEWERGNGTLFAGSGSTAFHFRSDAFAGHSLAIAEGDLSHVCAFLGAVRGDIVIRERAGQVCLINGSGDALWVPTPEQLHPKYSYHPHTADQFVMRVRCRDVLDALSSLTSSTLASSARTTLRYRHREADLSFRAVGPGSLAESATVPVEVIETLPRDVVFSVDVEKFARLFTRPARDTIELRFHCRPGQNLDQPERGAIRTVEEVMLDAQGRVVDDRMAPSPTSAPFACRITRLAIAVPPMMAVKANAVATDERTVAAGAT
jgi:hypothetical protein